MLSKVRMPALSFLAASLVSLGSISSQAAVIAVDLNVISSNTIGMTGVSLGTVTVTDIAGGVSVDVQLLSGVKFVDTGGPHTAFAYNLNASPTSVTITGPNPNSRTEVKKGTTTTVPLFTVLAGPQGATPYGTFSNGLDCPGCGPGASHAYGGPLDFRVMGVSVANFVANSGGYLFAADVIGPNGGTGSIAGNAISAGVPEPSTWAMMLVGFAGLGYAGYRKRKTAPIAA